MSDFFSCPCAHERDRNWGITMDYVAFRTITGPKPTDRLLAIVIRLTVLAAVGAVLLTLLLIGFFVVLPLMVIGGIASYVYLRRRVRQAQQRSQSGVIEAEYMVVDRR
jgi:Flp pilus assembly protein TadB